MKRGAERQLTRDIDDDEELDDATPGQGFKKADEAKLAARPMKGLPRRLPSASTVVTASAPAVAAAAPEQPGRPKFTGFSGFGAKTSGASPFSFSATTPATVTETTKPAVPAFTSSPFGSSSSTATPSFTPSVPAFGTNATAATKTFTTILNSAAKPLAASAPQTMEFKLPANNVDNEAINAETKFLTALRGINVSFLSTISKAIETDPFIDIAGLLERYKSFRVTAKEQYDAKLKKAQSPPSSTSSSAPRGSSSASVTPTSATLVSSTAAPGPSMPAPPSSFAGFKPLSSSSSPFGSSTSKDSRAPSGSGFTFGAPSSTSTSTSTATSSGLPAPPKSAFTFGSSTSASTPSSNPFNFGKPVAAEESDSTSSPFGGPAPSAFSSNLFSKPDEEASKPSDREVPPDPFAPASSSSTGSLFGGPSLFATPEKKEFDGPFAFGAGSPSKPAPFSGFGKPAGSIGNPVGFGFGSPPRSPDIEPPAGTSTPARSSGFSFAPAAEAGSSRLGSPDAAPSASEEAALATDVEPEPLVSSNSTMDAPGAGEEDEDTTHEVKSKAFRMVKKDGKAVWNDLGVGMLRLKKHKESEVRRVLMRNSTTGKVTINFQVHSGMSPAVDKRTVSFMGHDEGASAPYRIRMKTDGEASDLKSALDREIEFVRAKSETT